MDTRTDLTHVSFIRFMMSSVLSISSAWNGVYMLVNFLFDFLFAVQFTGTSP